MRILDRYKICSRASLLLVLGSICLSFLATQSASGQEACPAPPGYEENPLSTPSITAAEVAANPTPDNLRIFSTAVQDYLSPLDPLELVHALCLMRQEESDWRSGGIFVVLLRAYPPDFTNMRVFFHAQTMALSGRRVLREIAGAILAAAASDPAGGAPVPGFGGHAAFRDSFITLVGLDVQEPQMDPVVIDSHYVPQVAASEVVDRASLKIFANEAINYITQLFLNQTYGFETFELLRAVFRDKNGPWISGPVYLIVFDPDGYTIFHGAFPDRYEYRVTGTARDAVTGELLLPRFLAAAQQEEGGFVEYHFDNPDDDSDSAEIPKVAYVRRQDLVIEFPGGSVTQSYYLAAGFYPREGTGSGLTMTSGCTDRNIAASAVRTQGDVRAFVTCAAEYLAEHGTREAHRAFHEDPRWRHGQTYLGVLPLSESGTNTRSFVFPPDPSRERRPWGSIEDDFGDDLFSEIYRIMQLVDAGWVYYTFADPTTGRRKPKASYVIKVDWDGAPATIGAGVYLGDWPGTCYEDEVNAAALGANPSAATLREFVRCAAAVVESDGYFAMEELEADPRWTHGAHYLYVLDMMGNQVMSGNPVRVNGKVLHEWGRGGGQFGGRDMIDVGDTFGETYVYYRSFNPQAGAQQPKAGFLKRVVAQGVPLLVGSGYYVGSGPSGAASGCADNYVEAPAVHTQADIQAFVQCAAEYVLEHGEAEARRAFNEDARWKSGSTYVFVDGVQPSGQDSLTHVFPPDPSREGTVWGTSIDSFGSDYYFELHRILSMVDEGWIYYAFNNPETGRPQPKSSYVMEIEWNGERAAIGAGIYARDFPGACEPGEVHAADLAANPGDQRLQEFVRCAAMTVESSGYFAGPVLSGDPRWNHGPIYIFGINVETGNVEFSGNPASFATSGRIPELLFDGRDAIAAGKLFGETFWYYRFDNPDTGEAEAKVAFSKLVRAQGVPLLLGSGYNR